MKKLPFIGFFLLTVSLFAQTDRSSFNYDESELAMHRWMDFTSPPQMPFLIPVPPSEPVRHMAEWEELEAIVVTWRSFQDVLVEIIRHAKEEVKVIIVVSNQGILEAAQQKLLDNGINFENIEFIVRLNDSVWVRDYGQTPVYANEVEDLYFIDWIYNDLEREEDDLVPEAISEELEVPLYTTTEGEYKLVHVGGNFMSDGLGTGFSSELIFEDNGPGNEFGVGPLSEDAIDNLMQQYLGIDRYIKFPMLPYDGIHHIDMHSHLIDEETWIFGEYPEGVADGPQIEANIEYLQENFKSAFGTNYRIERIIMPPDADGDYPNEAETYRTYTNCVFINKTILVPTYEPQYDSLAMAVYERLFPGYKIVGINCENMVQFYGALHCITKEIGSPDPLWIVHQRICDIENNNLYGDYDLSAHIKHQNPIINAELFWKTDLTEEYQIIEMHPDPLRPFYWNASIPHQPNGTEIFYFIKGEASSGKTQVRPLAAPEGYYHFTVNDFFTSTSEQFSTKLNPIYPNPASSSTVIPVQVEQAGWVTIDLFDVNGNIVGNIFTGALAAGNHRKFLQAGQYASGAYFVRLQTEHGIASQTLIIK